MKKLNKILLISLSLIFSAFLSSAQDLTFEDFVGTWNGTISSTTFGGYSDPITMTIEPDGNYTETSGHLMPSIYPNTQECDFDAPTNRFHWWYLDLVYSGQYFYQHFYYEIVYFSNDTLEMHYNFWDDPEPHPEVGTIFLVKEDLTPPPGNLEYELYGNNVILSWEDPQGGNGPAADPTSYNVYYRKGDGSFMQIGNIDGNSFAHEDVVAAGMHSYYITAVYDEGESDPSNQVSFELLTPAPDNLVVELQGNNAVLTWSEPSAGNSAMAGLLGYNIYHKVEAAPFDLLAFVESTGYTHEDISYGNHSYYVTAVYEGGESIPSNEVVVELIISSVKEDVDDLVLLFPNPAGDVVFIRSNVSIQSLAIYGQTGRRMLLSQGRMITDRINISDFVPGLYFVRIVTADGEVLSRSILVR